MFKAAFERFGCVDTLVNNAGIFMARPFAHYSQGDYAILIGTHVALSGWVNSYFLHNFASQRVRFKGAWRSLTRTHGPRST